MGSVKIDTAAKGRQYTATYTLSDPKGVAKLLRDRHRISERRYRGDYDASDIIIDLHSAIESAALTERQAEAIAWVYGRDLTFELAGEIMRCTKQGAKAFIDGACEKVAEVYRKWEERGDGDKAYTFTVEYEDITEGMTQNDE